MPLCCLRLPHVQTRTVLSSGSRFQINACLYGLIAGSFVCRKPTILFLAGTQGYVPNRRPANDIDRSPGHGTDPFRQIVKRRKTGSVENAARDSAYYTHRRSLFITHSVCATALSQRH
jgi:hypothetical protein